MYRTRDWRRDQNLRRKQHCHRILQADREDHEKTWWHHGFTYSAQYYTEDYWHRMLRQILCNEGKVWRRATEHRSKRCCECGLHACDWCLTSLTRAARKAEERLDNDLHDYLCGEYSIVEEGESIIAEAPVLRVARPYKLPVEQ